MILCYLQAMERNRRVHNVPPIGVNVYLPRAVRNPQSRPRRSKQSSRGGCSRNNEGDQSLAPSSVVATAGDGLLPTPSQATAPTLGMSICL